MVNTSTTSANDCRIIQLPKIEDQRGNLSFIEGKKHIPFTIARVYWIYDVPGGQKRTGHAYYEMEEFIVALSGSFDVLVDDGRQQRIFSLNRSYYGLYIPNLLWRTLDNFSTNSLGMILASQPYTEEEYLRDYQKFLRAKA